MRGGYHLVAGQRGPDRRGDTSTLADAAVVDTIREHSGQAED